MRKKIWKNFLGLSLAVALLMVALATSVLYVTFDRQLDAQLKQEAVLMASMLESTPNNLPFLENALFTNRITWIAADGSVLYDNQSSAKTMSNHLQREEIAEAIESGIGNAKRVSQTLRDEQVYYAVRMTDGTFLRLSASQKSLGGMMWQMLGWVLLGFACITVLTGLISRRLTRKLVAPINAIDLEDPLGNEVYDEFSPMLRRMEEQNRKITGQVQEISARQGELNALIGSMREGLVILDGKQHVLAMNQSAVEILGSGGKKSDHHKLWEYHRHPDLRRAVEEAAQNGNAKAQLSVSSREYVVNASAVDGNRGMVLLFQDCTERNEAERARKRFTANVSHELRTPLTTIGGYAELMQNNMVKPEDVPSFAGRIHGESMRLLKLVEDILHLSRLDEGFAHGTRQNVALDQVANAAAQGLFEAAKAKNVSVSVEGSTGMVSGDAVLLEEMLRNLIENGIKYNRDGGTVRVLLSESAEACLVSVEDSGIGIPKEHCDKVFERFYRVDSSRSKETGGTGLGLSIVKHGAEYHHAVIALESKINQGTRITLTFPKA